MDIVLEQLMIYVDDLVGLISEVAPAVWEILIRQVYVDAFSAVPWFALGIVLIFISKYLFNQSKVASTTVGHYDTLSKQGVWIFWSGVTGLVSFIAISTSLVYAVSRIINPAFYVIRFLLNRAGIQ